jgi:dTDP-4-dehydrorhamnose reductase
MRVLLTGASGQLGAYLLMRLARSDHHLVACSRSVAGENGRIPWIPVDLSDASATLRALDSVNPEVIIHAAALSSAALCFRDPQRARIVNVEATERLAEWCQSRSRRLIFTSTDLVFDGSQPWNREDDRVAPVLEYGRTKQLAEQAVRLLPRGLVARVSLLFGPSRNGRESYYDRIIAALHAGEAQTFFEDEFRTPLHFRVAADILSRLLDAEHSGVVHLGGAERLSRFALIQRIVRALGLNDTLVLANRQTDVTFDEPRPADVSLDTTRLLEWLPNLERPSIEKSVAEVPGIT